MVRKLETLQAADTTLLLTDGEVEFVFEYVPGLSTSHNGSEDQDQDHDEVEDKDSEASTPPPLDFVPLTPLVSHSPVDVSSVVEHSTGSSAADYSSRSVSFILTPTASSAHLVSPDHLLRRHWPLANEHEATLLRHFVTDLSSWFDYGDPQNTFATSVVQCAASSPPLLNAIFAVSCRHLGLKKGDTSSELADNYHRTCLKLLIPLLNDTNAALDERLYAATVILRLYEEIMGQDMENHLMGTHTFVRLQEYAQSSPIRQAVFRVALRQEIVISFRTQRPVQLLREYVRADHSLTAGSPTSIPGSGEDDWALAFHIFVLCAEVLTFCYGEDTDSLGSTPATPPQSWDDLAWRAQQWVDTVPLSYEPLLYRPPGPGHVFPTIMLLNDCHACIAIAICGDLFTELEEQQAMFSILVKTDTELAWPTAAIQAHLRERWGWA
ncbi:hypothetical protein SCUCBS95973_007586 [Sporothrix curviconia]|uniref:Uncharacterized protein n=1 Tax=Sporothrix curviconia TaxID=1260050 RepID=A0ABP0CEI9_9PEZI